MLSHTVLVLRMIIIKRIITITCFLLKHPRISKDPQTEAKANAPINATLNKGTVFPRQTLDISTKLISCAKKNITPPTDECRIGEIFHLQQGNTMEYNGKIQKCIYQ